MFQRVLRLGQALAWLRRLSCFSTCTTSGRILESSFRLSSPKGNPILMLHGYFDVKQSTVLTGLITQLASKTCPWSKPAHWCTWTPQDLVVSDLLKEKFSVSGVEVRWGLETVPPKREIRKSMHLQ